VLIARAGIDGRATHGEVEDGRFYPIDGDVFAGDRSSGTSRPLESLDLLSPVEPKKILVIMGGFMPKDGSPLPPGSEPILLPKAPAWLQGDNAEIAIPPSIERTWAEVELAIVIGKRIHGVSLAEAEAAIFGYACFNDASAPEFLAVPDYWRLKSIDTFASLGPWIRTDVTEEQIARGLRLSTHVNGVLKGEGNTRNLKFRPSEVVHFAATYSTLCPGDVITLGTPVPVEVVSGDYVELAVEGIGVLRNRMVTAQPGSNGLVMSA
jgi:2-keto-4-pentenoate hydratase/2-oxohepta-3-ene-1,7-dioic acid hydratase in catechol pathway